MWTTQGALYFYAGVDFLPSLTKFVLLTRAVRYSQSCHTGVPSARTRHTELYAVASVSPQQAGRVRLSMNILTHCNNKWLRPHELARDHCDLFASNERSDAKVLLALVDKVFFHFREQLVFWTFNSRLFDFF